MRITEILSKPVISLLNSRTEGIVKSVIFDKSFKKVKWIILFDNNEYLEEKVLNICDIYSLGENAIVIKNGECLNLGISTIKEEEKTLPINNNVYTVKGKYVGNVIDINIDEKYNIISLVLNNEKEILLSEVVASGEDAVIIQDDKTSVNISAFKPKKNKKTAKKVNTNNNQKVVILNDQVEKTEVPNNNNETMAFENTIIENGQKELVLEEKPEINETMTQQKLVKKYELNKDSTPQTFSVNESFLLNRKIEKNIYTQNKELIARKNVKITQDIINKAKLHYKLRELIKYSK